jgi:DNA-binding HxlR family transcriptional regulator
MKTLTMLDFDILRVLQYKSGNLTFISGYLPFKWNGLSRKDLWNRTKHLIHKGLIVRDEEISESTLKDKTTYKLTEMGYHCVSYCENKQNDTINSKIRASA